MLMTAMRPAKRELIHYFRTAWLSQKLKINFNVGSRIIQDCEDALTNWVTANAAVKPKLSTRAHTLSQRRKAGRGQRNPEGVDLSGQDQSLKDRESGLWVPAGAHREYIDMDDEDLERDDDINTHHIGETRGREEERATEA